MIVVLNYGMGNTGSILNMLKRSGTEAILSSNPADIRKADKLILPGVGSFDAGIRCLKQYDLIEILTEVVVLKGTPILGICLGMQLFGKGSEEGVLPGLGWIDMRFDRFQLENQSSSYKIPHMGWNSVEVGKSSPLTDDFSSDERFYFVHSYHAVCAEPSDILLQSVYGYPFPAAVARNNIYGVQFHPEKSHRFGLKLLNNFVERC